MSREHGFKVSKQELKLLKIAHKNTKSKRKSYRLNALILLGQGWTYVEVSEALLLDIKTLRNYVNRYQADGIPGVLDDNYQPNANKLTETELNLLDQHLQEVTYQKVEEIVDYVESEFDVKFSRSGMNELLHRLGFSYKKPRKVPGKANAEDQKKFVKKYKRIRKNMTKNDHLLFLDGVHPHHNPLVMSGWIKKGVSKPLFSNTRYTRLNILGAVDIDTHDMVTQFSDTLNEEAALDFLEKVRKRYKKGKVYIVLDNASYFKGETFKKYAASMAIELIYLPPYSPNLNLVERVWLFFQKNVLYNKYYPTFEIFKNECTSFFRDFHQFRESTSSLLTEKFETLVMR